MSIITKEEFLSNKWVSILQLNDWTIDFKYHCSPEEMTLDGVAGEAEYVESRKYATVRILNKSYYNETTIKYDFEQVLVHELLHIKFCLFWNDADDNCISNRLLHQMIDDMAKSLVKAWRRDY